MTSRAFLTDLATPLPPDVRLQPVGRTGFEAAADARLRTLLQVYAEAAVSGLPSARTFPPELLLALGMRARVQRISVLQDAPPPVAAALRRAAAGPRLHGRPARYRLTTASGARLVALLPLGADDPWAGLDQQREVVEVLAAFGL